MVLDTIGELAQLYQIATVVFVGGSLVPAGGHNILEPALYGKPIVFGPHMENFAEIAEASSPTARPSRCARSASSKSGRRPDGDPVRRARLGAAARALVEANRGAKDTTLAVHHRAASPASAASGGPSLPRDPLSVLSASYGHVARMRRSWYERHPPSRRRLERPVISVGNLSVGGSGKTPVVAALARMLHRDGAAAGDPQPRLRATRTQRRRGRRQRRERVLEPVERSGDEPQMLARALPVCRCSCAPIAISPDGWPSGSSAAR